MARSAHARGSSDPARALHYPPEGRVEVHRRLQRLDDPFDSGMHVVSLRVKHRAKARIA